MTAERGFAVGTVTDTGVIATSSAVPNAASGPLRCNVNVAVVTEGALRSRLKPAVIEAGSASTVAFGAGDNDVTLIGPERRGARLCAVGDPLPNDIDVRLRHGRQTGRHAFADTGRAFELLDQIAVVRIACGNAQDVRALAARHTDEQQSSCWRRRGASRPAH